MYLKEAAIIENILELPAELVHNKGGLTHQYTCFQKWPPWVREP